MRRPLRRFLFTEVVGLDIYILDLFSSSPQSKMLQSCLSVSFNLRTAAPPILKVQKSTTHLQEQNTNRTHYFPPSIPLYPQPPDSLSPHPPQNKTKTTHSTAKNRTRVSRQVDTNVSSNAPHRRASVTGGMLVSHAARRRKRAAWRATTAPRWILVLVVDDRGLC